MARAKANKLYRTFVRGLITEASYLTYPEDSSNDELNTVVSRKGNRTRRLGMTYQGMPFVPGTVSGINEFEARAEYIWRAVANRADVNFLVMQRGSTLWFFSCSIEPLTAGKGTYEVDLSKYFRPNLIYYPFNTVCQFASGKGYLFVVHPGLEPFVVTYDPDRQVFSDSKIVIMQRDLEGVNDNLANDEEPTVLTKEHHYNLQNQGWVTSNRSQSSGPDVNLNGYIYKSDIDAIDPFRYLFRRLYQIQFNDGPIAKYRNEIGRFPGNNTQWWVAKADADDPDKKFKAGDFLPEILTKFFNGNNRAPRGHYILDAFRKDRAAVSGISDIPVEDLNIR